MRKPTLDTLSEDVLSNIVFHLVQPPLQDVLQREPRTPTLLPLFNLAQTCKRLQEVLNRPEDNDTYWRQIMLDSGTGRPCEPPLSLRLWPSSGDSDEEVIRSYQGNQPSSWKTMAIRQAHLEKIGRDAGVFLGRGIPAPVLPGEVSEYYNWVPQVMGEVLPVFPHPESHRVLKPEESRKHSIYVNLPALYRAYPVNECLGYDRYPGFPNVGTFITQPPVQELEVYVCFREGVADEILEACDSFNIGVFDNGYVDAAIISGLLSVERANVEGGHKHRPKSIRLENPTGITIHDFRTVIETWIKRAPHEHPGLRCCEILASEAQADSYKWAHYLWNPPVFPAPSDEPLQSDWFFRVINGGKMLVGLSFDIEELTHCFYSSHKY